MKTGRFVLFIAMLLSLCCCPSISEKTPEQKSATIASLGPSHIAGEPIDIFFRNRMADVIVANEIARVEYLKNNKKKLIFDGKKTDNTDFKLGSAAAVSKHGYFLTAAHNVAGVDEIWLISKSEENPYHGRARVVWIKEEQDVALLWTEDNPTKYFTIACNLPRVDSIVVLGGHRGGCSAGRILALTQKQAGPDTFMEIEHTAPMVRGDSGGPLITTEGQLLGINFAWNTKHLGTSYKSTAATAIDGEWLEKVIAEDIASVCTRRIQRRGPCGTKPAPLVRR